MKKPVMRSLILGITLSASVVLGACGGSSSSSYSSDSYSGGSYKNAAMEADGLMYDSAGYEAANEEAYEEAYDAGSGSEKIEGDVTDDLDVAAVDLSREKLVYSASLTVETVEYDNSKAAFKSLMESNGAVIQNESENSDAILTGGDYTSNADAFKMGERHYNATVRVPSENFYSFLNGLGGIGVTTSMSSDVQNLTQEYSDISAILKADEEELKQLHKWLSEADNAEDMTTLYRRITEIQSEINKYKSRLRMINTDVAFSTVSVSLREVIQYSKAVDPVDELTFGRRVAKAVKESIEAFAELMEGLLIFVIHILPEVLLIILIICIVRWYRKKHPKKEKPGKEKRKLFGRNKNVNPNVVQNYPVQPADPGQSGYPVQPVDPAQQNGLVQPVNTAEPANTVQPANSGQPVDPAQPADPGNGGNDGAADGQNDSGSSEDKN
ncbi:MAG: DUF4349 domain-containing protein [Lachnospiraceae bacterium]|nr:DUF4349 domain-containing protein [Lachnospiraceae bacterium]